MAVLSSVARFGRSCLCGPVSLAHGLNCAWLQCLSHLTFRLGIVPQTAVAFQTCVRKNGVMGMARCPESLLLRQEPMSSLTPAICTRQTARSCPSHIVHISHSQPHSHPPCAPPTTTSSTPTPSLTTCTCTCTHCAPSHHNNIPARLGTRQGALWHPHCPTHGAARPSRKYAASARTAS
jgi:hypothetical protein